MNFVFEFFDVLCLLLSNLLHFYIVPFYLFPQKLLVLLGSQAILDFSLKVGQFKGSVFFCRGLYSIYLIPQRCHTATYFIYSMLDGLIVIFEDQFKMIELFLVCSRPPLYLQFDFIQLFIEPLPNRAFQMTTGPRKLIDQCVLLGDPVVELLDRGEEFVGVDSHFKEVAQGQFHYSQKIFSAVNGYRIRQKYTGQLSSQKLQLKKFSLLAICLLLLAIFFNSLCISSSSFGFVNKLLLPLCQQPIILYLLRLYPFTSTNQRSSGSIFFTSFSLMYLLVFRVIYPSPSCSIIVRELNLLFSNCTGLFGFCSVRKRSFAFSCSFKETRRLLLSSSSSISHISSSIQPQNVQSSFYLSSASGGRGLKYSSVNSVIQRLSSKYYLIQEKVGLSSGEYCSISLMRLAIYGLYRVSTCSRYMFSLVSSYLGIDEELIDISRTAQRRHKPNTNTSDFRILIEEW